MAYNKIDEGPQRDFKMRVTHEVSACHALEDAIICRQIALPDSVSLLCQNLCSLCFKVIVLQVVLRTVLFIAMVRSTRLLALPSSQLCIVKSYCGTYRILS